MTREDKRARNGRARHHDIQCPAPFFAPRTTQRPRR
eukprot:CAMPEP_0185830126 /NCGR_PEP_ID=MMETSP1353-20130828/643_1 /TAXON_ID=1077150 /ORGANISM="Erythrolobus australicus, Strain CCMP3124" /LENGTH=35 /DNA_ID= /DNA_START= /DNA_END= /DNA_ORIENTATION=